MFLSGKTMANLRQCSRCKSTIDISYFSINRKKEYYKTCDRCRSKRNKTSVISEEKNETDDNKHDLQNTINSCKDIKTQDEFFNYYLNLPEMDFNKKFDEDLTLECIAPLNHSIHIGDTFYRKEGNLYKYGEFTKRNEKEYPLGKNPDEEYMPYDNVSPVILKVNGKIYKASMITWFVLTDCSDAVKAKQYITTKSIYPIYIKKEKQAIAQVINTIGFKFLKNLPMTQRHEETPQEICDNIKKMFEDYCKNQKDV
jgi:hypothetical protein